MNGTMAKTRFRLLAVGVGGQGVLTATRLLGEAARIAGQNAVLGQLHGMSQRGGSVSSTVLIGPGLASFVGDGQADVVLGLEPLEVLRALPKISARTTVLVNTDPISPFILASRGESYPDLAGILAGIRAAAPRTCVTSGRAALGAANDERSLNIFMLGALSGLDVLPFAEDYLRGAIERRSPTRHLESIRRAYLLGRESVATTE